MSEEYIRGTRQLKAIAFFVEMVLRRNWLGARRELEIMSGFAKPYAVCFRCGEIMRLCRVGAVKRLFTELQMH
jgi:hypothetical protein